MRQFCFANTTRSSKWLVVSDSRSVLIASDCLWIASAQLRRLSLIRFSVG